jgi:aminoglycoside phosphotransferase family enzyme
MKYSEALAQGITEFGVPNRIVSTLISDVFFFGDKVIKVYKHNKHFFADLSSFESRKAFYEEDFFWNNTASPQIYLRLVGIKTNDHSLVPLSEADDFFIEMKKIDDTQTLTKLLLRKEITVELAQAFIVRQVSVLKELTIQRREKLDYLFQRSLSTIMKDNTQSLFDWMSTVSDIDRGYVEEIRQLLSQAITTDDYFNKEDRYQLSAAFDNNCDNLLVIAGTPCFIDILSPMETWRVVDEYATISRTIVDLEVLHSLGLGQVARKTYSRYSGDISRVAMLAHELRAAAIQWPYRYMINQEDVAVLYGKYTMSKMVELRQELAK